MTTLILIRHGQSVGNLLKVFCGQKDYDLSERGEVQAELTAAYLKEHYSIDKIYSSDLTRAYRTAEPTARLYDLPIEKDPCLRELSAGCFEGMSEDRVLNEDRELFERWRRGEEICPEGGETHSRFQKRVDAFFDRILATDSGKAVAIFSHWCVVGRALHRFLENHPNKDLLAPPLRIPNGSVSVLRVDERTGEADPLLMGHGEHLGIFKSAFNGNTV